MSMKWERRLVHSASIDGVSFKECTVNWGSQILNRDPSSEKMHKRGPVGPEERGYRKLSKWEVTFMKWF